MIPGFRWAPFSGVFRPTNCSELGLKRLICYGLAIQLQDSIAYSKHISIGFTPGIIYGKFRKISFRLFAFLICFYKKSDMAEASHFSTRLLLES